jgi:hypothetical protein
VICYDPLDLDPTAREEKGEGSLWGSPRRGPAVLSFNGGVLLAGFDGDGVLDGVQEFTAMTMAKRRP